MVGRFWFSKNSNEDQTPAMLTLWSAGRARRVQHQSDISFLRTAAALKVSASAFRAVFVIDFDVAAVEADFGHCDVELAGGCDCRVDGRGRSCTLRDEQQFAFRVAEVECDFLLLVSRVEWRCDASNSRRSESQIACPDT